MYIRAMEKALVAVILCSLSFMSCAQSGATGNANTKNSKQNSQLSLEQSKKLMTPTLYVIPTFNIDKMQCSSKKIIKDESGKNLFEACSSVYENCELEGTCQIQQGGKKVLLNVGSIQQGQRRFNVVNDSACVYGHGARRDQVAGYKTMCLDPFRSVAADLRIYNLGDVIYVPAVVGVKLPDGSIHDGYFIVRDTGGAIKGYGRFDFFIGFTAVNSDSNPFKELGFGDKDTNLPYYVVKAPEATEYLKKRNFPLIPVSK